MHGPLPADPVLLQSKAATLLETGDVQQALAVAGDELVSVRAALGDDPARWTPLLVHLLETQAQALIQLGQFGEAEAPVRDAIQLAEGNPELPYTFSRLLTTLCAVLDQSEMGSAELMPHYERAIATLEALEVPDLITAARLRNNLAMALKKTGKLALAEQNYLRALETLEGALGKDTEEVASIYNNLGSLYYSAGFPDQAAEMFNEGLAIRISLLGPEHPDVAQSLSNIGTVKYELGLNDDAKDCFERAMTILEGHLEDKSTSYEAMAGDYVALLCAIGEEDRAEEIQQRIQRALAA